MAATCRVVLLNSIFVLVFVGIAAFQQRPRFERKSTDFLNALLIDYNNQIPPLFEREEPCQVWIGLFINSFNSIQETDMEFTTDIIIEQRWTDDRLRFYDLVPAVYLELDARMIDKIWVPDLYFRNEKMAAFHDVTVPNRLLHLYHNGSIVYKIRISVTATCYMDLQNYPIDRQLCSLVLQSFAFSRKTLVLSWADQAVLVNPSTPLPHFNLLRSEVDRCDGTTIEGNFSCLQVNFYLDRYLGFYLLHMYMPTILVVAVSWLSFWLHPCNVAARTSLGILTVLTITTQGTSAASSLPKVSYIKAIDIWMAVCLFFVFAAFLQYAVVSVAARNAASQWRRSAETRCLRSSIFDPESFTMLKENKVYLFGSGEDFHKRCPNDEYGETTELPQAQLIDKVCRIAFPVAFLLFATVYWLYYTVPIS